MDVSPKTLREVEFREKMRGYHPEDVDQFLERVAAGIEVLQDRLRQAIERAQRAEQAANESGSADDSLRRTLLLAQRTADLAVSEGREQAARIIAAAEQQVQGMISEAEAAARRGHEDTVVEIRSEVTKLEARRQQLQAEIEALARWAEGQRHQLRVGLEAALATVGRIELNVPRAEPAAVQGQPSPGPSPVRADPPPPRPSPPPPAEQAPRPQAHAPVPVEQPGPRLPSPVPVQQSGPPPAPPIMVEQPGPRLPSPVPVEQPARFLPSEPFQVPTSGAAMDNGPMTIAWPPEDRAPDIVPGDADPYFAELRRAISDSDPLGPRPGAAPPTSSGGGEPPGDELSTPDFVEARRFGGRLRRRF